MKQKLTTHEKQAATKLLAASLIETHHLKVSVNGQPHMVYRDTHLAPCAHCKAELPKAGNAITELVWMWERSREESVISLCMQDAKNPLSHIEGFPIIPVLERCPACNEKNLIISQLIV